MVQAYLRMSRGGAQSSRRREYLTALRRETAKYGRNPDLVEFDCLLLCMSCGHLADPVVGDPMRSEPQVSPSRCGMCGTPGMLDLRQTPMVESLCELEATDVSPGPAWWAAKTLGVLGWTALFVGLLALVGTGLLNAVFDELEAWFLLLSFVTVGSLVLTRFVSSLRGRARRRSLPRRWRMPRAAKRRGVPPQRRVRGHAETSVELLRAPLSGRPCVAYELAVRDDERPTGRLGSWRLIEQDSVGFSVGELEVAPGEALLQLRRELVGGGTIGSKDDATRRYMRMRGLLDSEDVHIYETILAPGDECAVSRRADGPVIVTG